MNAPHFPDSGLVWRNRLARLGAPFVTSWRPTAVRAPHWVACNEGLRQELGLPENFWQRPGTLEVLSGNGVWPGSEPLASVYSGHQFGVWAGQLGDGRALWLGEADSPLGPQEWQLKGAGRTPYSRMGDGRAVLRSSIREYLCSEAMQGLGIATTRALCITGSSDAVVREEVETAAVVTRIAPSFLRFGHFEHFAATDQRAALQQLADWAIAQYFPDLPDGAAQWQGNVYAALLHRVVQLTSRLVAQWQAVGFCHGVMNTDNMSLLGLTLDYGPFQFMDGFDPDHICNHSDTQGRYAYGRQPQIAYWNLFCLGQALMPLIADEDLALAALHTYKDCFANDWTAQMRRKLGLVDAHEGDRDLAEQLLLCLAQERVDYTVFWRTLSQGMGQAQGDSVVYALFRDAQPLRAWLHAYDQRLGTQDRAAVRTRMLRANPRVVLRNHLAEVAIRQAQQGDFSEISTLRTLLQHPYDDHPGQEGYASVPPAWASSLAISCSS